MDKELVIKWLKGAIAALEQNKTYSADIKIALVLVESARQGMREELESEQEVKSALQGY